MYCLKVSQRMEIEKYSQYSNNIVESSEISYIPINSVNDQHTKAEYDSDYTNYGIMPPEMQ